MKSEQTADQYAEDLRPSGCVCCSWPCALRCLAVRAVARADSEQRWLYLGGVCFGLFVFSFEMTACIIFEIGSERRPGTLGIWSAKALTGLPWQTIRLRS